LVQSVFMRRRCRLRGRGECRISPDGRELTRDFGRSLDKIHYTRGDGASRHAVALRGTRILGEGNAASVLDGFQAECSVRRGAGEDDADGLVPSVRGKGVEKG